MIGKTLSHYEIISLLGKGGMGEVYQAKDLTLGRDVAIKVLPIEFAQDADRVTRFQREAKLLASLNHPNIAAIHGLEESGGTNFLVMELIEGDTLAERLKRGPIPIEESLKLSLQITEALEAAHEKGIIHRDLKPSNIKITPDEKVKVLDFGLAKAYAGEQNEAKSSDSPTISNAATRQGVILGTAAYMSPEQAKGKAVDKRADIWAFGCVLFEMLTGRAAFSGSDVTDIIAAVIRAEPEWGSLPLNIHSRLREVIERSLKKDVKDRYRDISDVKADIQRVITDPSGVLVKPVIVSESRMRLRNILPWVAAAVIVTAIIAWVVVWKLMPPEPKQVMRFACELPEGQQFNQHPLLGAFILSVSPDGNQLVYAADDGLYLRSVDSMEAKSIAGTDKGSLEPFFSPDGKWIGYWSSSENKLKKVAISGGAPIVLCNTAPLVIGASWNTDDTIVYSDAQSGIMRIPAGGGTPVSLIKGSVEKLNEGFPANPQMLPDGDTLLFTNITGLNMVNWQVMVQSLKTGERKVVLHSGFEARYLPTRHLVYTLAGKNFNSIYAIAFDLDKLDVAGGSVPIIENMRANAVSDSGTLAYIPGNFTPVIIVAKSSEGTLVWIDREGKEEPLGTLPNEYAFPKISPDGTQVAFSIGPDANEDIWIWDVMRKTQTRLTFDKTRELVPIWTLDGKRIVYWSNHEYADNGGVYWKASDGTGDVEKLFSLPDRAMHPFSWSSDGKTLVLQEVDSTSNVDISMLQMEGERKRNLLFQKPEFTEGLPKISPDGRWMAYFSDESDNMEVYVRPFPDVDKGKWQVSTSGGACPLWSPDGRELFYLALDNYVMAVPVETKPAFSLGTPKKLFKNIYTGIYIGGATPWDIHPDGKRFLMIKPQGTDSSASKNTINVVVNWFEELKQRVPNK
ncbi:MAG: serine/threonine-protein kinase [Deltaproteobacteria bacterium]|nr:serine/threonine-protein kinase [Deltaproteobacteria bacterium]